MLNKKLQADYWNKMCYQLLKLMVKSAAAKMARSKSVYQHTMGRGGYTLVKEKMVRKRVVMQEEWEVEWHTR
ncbi:hypothetical protein Tco_1495496, partial [Tanacetum coccineum]